MTDRSGAVHQSFVNTACWSNCCWTRVLSCCIEIMWSCRNVFGKAQKEKEWVKFCFFCQHLGIVKRWCHPLVFLLSLKATYKSVVDFKKQKSTSRRDCFGRSERKTFQGNGVSFQGIRRGSPQRLSEGILFVREILRVNKSFRFILNNLRYLPKEATWGVGTVPSIFNMEKQKGSSQIVT